jgi:acetyltransferase-like isoleucine patch superfamily enzyme
MKDSIIAKEAKVGKNVKIGNYCKIYPNVEIGDNTTIGDFCIIGHPTKKNIEGIDFSSIRLGIKESTTKIGMNSLIRSGSIIYSNVQIGHSLRTGHSVVIRENTNIGNDCLIGTKAVVDGYVTIGDKSFVQTNCYITQSTKIGSFVFIGPNVVTLDNKYIVLGKGLRGPKILNGVRIGANTTILPEVEIGEYSVIGAGSLVSQNIPSRTLAYGNPARVIRKISDEEIEEYLQSVSNWK